MFFRVKYLYAEVYIVKLNGVHHQRKTCYYEDNLIGNKNKNYDLYVAISPENLRYWFQYMQAQNIALFNEFIKFL